MAKTEERASQLAKKSRAYTRACAALGARIRSIRQEQQLILEAAAERMKMDPKHLQKVEVGQLNVTMVTLVRIGSGLGVGLADVFSDVASTAAAKKAPRKARTRTP